MSILAGGVFFIWFLLGVSGLVSELLLVLDMKNQTFNRKSLEIRLGSQFNNFMTIRYSKEVLTVNSLKLTVPKYH